MTAGRCLRSASWGDWRSAERSAHQRDTGTWEPSLGVEYVLKLICDSFICIRLHSSDHQPASDLRCGTMLVAVLNCVIQELRSQSGMRASSALVQLLRASRAVQMELAAAQLGVPSPAHCYASAASSADRLAPPPSQHQLHPSRRQPAIGIGAAAPALQAFSALPGTCWGAARPRLFSTEELRIL
jgi:hypothetical protein